VDLLASVVLIIAHNASFDRRFLSDGFRYSPKILGMPSLAVEMSPATPPSQGRCLRSKEDFVEVAKTDLANAGNVLSVEPVGLAISGRRLISLPAALWRLLRRHLDVGPGMGRAEA
jgi:hypothetical protein